MVRVPEALNAVHEPTKRVIARPLCGFDGERVAVRLQDRVRERVRRCGEQQHSREAENEQSPLPPAMPGGRDRAPTAADQLVDAVVVSFDYTRHAMYVYRAAAAYCSARRQNLAVFLVGSNVTHRGCIQTVTRMQRKVHRRRARSFTRS